MKMRARYLRSHQIHIVIESHRQQDVSFANAGLALDVNVNAVALNKLYAFQPRGAAESTRFFVYDGDLVAAFEKSCYCS
jgi:hypothetical protein